MLVIGARARRADGGARGRARRRARHPRATRISGSAAGCSPSARDRRHAGRRLGRAGRGRARGAARRAHPAPHHRVRRATTTAVLRRGRARHRPPAGAARAPAAPALWRIVAKRARARGRRASSGRSCSATTTGRASCWRARCAPTSTASPSRRGGASRVFTNNDDGWRTAADLRARPASRSRPSSTRAPSRRANSRRSASGAMHRRAVVARARPARRRSASTCVDATAAATKIACDALAVSGGWNPSSCISPPISAAGRSGPRTLAAFVPGTLPPRHARRRRGGRRADARPMPAPAAWRRARGARPSCGFTDGLDRAAARRRRAGSDLTPLWHVAASRGKAFVDFQNDVTANDVALADARGLPLGRAPQALHHARHGDRPGQDVERQRPRDPGRADRPQRFPRSAPRPSARPTRRSRIGALAGHHRGKRLPPDAADARRTTGRRSRAPSSSRPGRGCARSGIRAPARRTGCETVNREVTATRASVGICDVSTLGKIEIQGPDAGDLPRPRLHQHVLDAAVGKARYGADAARGRLRDGRRHRPRGSRPTTTS